MNQRRRFLALGLQCLAGAGLALAWPGHLWADAKRRVLGGHLKPTKLYHLNPKNLDNRNLSITPLQEFGTMGQSEVAVDPAAWRLTIDGAVKRPMKLGLAQIKARPVLARTVLLVCPGVFSYNARWTGLSLGRLLEEAGLEPGVDRVDIRGPAGAAAKLEHFSLREVLDDRVFLAYQVNGRDLPRKHGFPLRVVAGEHYGDDWVKYAARITAVASGKRK
jgi:sulfoxide reductase catalytic subunit YedY